MRKFLFLSLLVFSLASMSLAPSDVAPDFSAKNQDGKTIHLSDYRGKFVLLYFYPKDETPGCTKEACNFRDAYVKIKQMNAVVFGVSRQDEKSHQEFKTKHRLPFDLLVDTNGELAKRYDVGSIPLVGLTRRESVLISPEGKVVRFYGDVDPAKHTQEVIDDIRAARSKS